MTRLALYERVWTSPLTFLAPQFEISGVALKKTCAKFDIPVPEAERGYWARRQAGKPTTRSRCRPGLPKWTMRSLLVVAIATGTASLPKKRFSARFRSGLHLQNFALVRDRVRKIIGRVSVPKAIAAPYPAIARLIVSPVE
jgi:hypothetical protein